MAFRLRLGGGRRSFLRVEAGRAATRSRVLAPAHAATVAARDPRQIAQHWSADAAQAVTARSVADHARAVANRVGAEVMSAGGCTPLRDFLWCRPRHSQPPLGECQRRSPNDGYPRPPCTWWRDGRTIASRSQDADARPERYALAGQREVDGTVRPSSPVSAGTVASTYGSPWPYVHQHRAGGVILDAYGRPRGQSGAAALDGVPAMENNDGTDAPADAPGRPSRVIAVLRR